MSYITKIKVTAIVTIYINLPQLLYCGKDAQIRNIRLIMLQHTDTSCKISEMAKNHKEHTIYVTSFLLFRTMVLSQRPNDDDHKNGFTRWPFMTTHTWAENPRGLWKLQISMAPGKNNAMDTGSFFEWTLILHGTKDAPYDKQVVDGNKHTKLYKVKRVHEAMRKAQTELLHVLQCCCQLKQNQKLNNRSAQWCACKTFYNCIAEFWPL